MPMPDQPSQSSSPILIIDGICSLCNHTLDLILRMERRPWLRFTANQLEPGKQILSRFGLPQQSIDTVCIYFPEQEKLLVRSDAALFLATRVLRFPWPLLGIGYIFPRFFRDAVYHLVAINRYRWFGKRETCRLPSPEEKSRFLT